MLGLGSPPTPVNQNQRGELTDNDRRHPQDNSPMDEYTFEVASGWEITVDMHSDGELGEVLEVARPVGGTPDG